MSVQWVGVTSVHPEQAACPSALCPFADRDAARLQVHYSQEWTEAPFCPKQRLPHPRIHGERSLLVLGSTARQGWEKRG